MASDLRVMVARSGQPKFEPSLIKVLEKVLPEAVAIKTEYSDTVE